MASRPTEARLFVALDLPSDAREALVEWRESALGGHDGLRPVPARALHVTLAFLGHLPEGEIGRVARLMRAAVPSGAAPTLRSCKLKAVPPRRTRLYALELADEHGRAGRIQAALSGALEAAGLYEPEKRPFWPHVTLARVRPRQRAPRLDGIAPPPAGTWRAEAVSLYRSRLSPRGADYESLERVALG